MAKYCSDCYNFRDDSNCCKEGYRCSKDDYADNCPKFDEK